MKKVALCCALLLLASGCNDNADEPVIQQVPSDVRVINGTWAGTVYDWSPASQGQLGETIEILSTATPIDSTSYTATGQLTFKGMIYGFTGTVKGLDNLTFRAQTTDLRKIPHVVMLTDIMQSGLKVGKIELSNYPARTTKYQLSLYFSDRTYYWMGDIQRVQGE